MEGKKNIMYPKIKFSIYLCVQAQESALLSEDLRGQLETVQQRLKEVREEVVENSISREKESFNARRAQVHVHTRNDFIAVELITETRQNSISYVNGWVCEHGYFTLLGGHL